MAKFKSHGIESISMSLSVLSNLPDEAAYNVLEAGAAVLIEKWKEKLLPMKRTGQLIESIKAKHKTGSNGLPVISVAPTGKRKNGYTGRRKKRDGSPGGTYQGSNAEVGYFLEYGTPRMRATHWMETANEEAADAVIDAESKAFDDFLDSV